MAGEHARNRCARNQNPELKMFKVELQVWKQARCWFCDHEISRASSGLEMNLRFRIRFSQTKAWECPWMPNIGPDSYLFATLQKDKQSLLAVLAYVCFILPDRWWPRRDRAPAQIPSSSLTEVWSAQTWTLGTLFTHIIVTCKPPCRKHKIHLYILHLQAMTAQTEQAEKNNRKKEEKKLEKKCGFEAGLYSQRPKVLGQS